MKNPVLTQACANLVRVVRQHVGLVHSLRRQNELNEILDGIRLEYWKNVQEGKSPEPAVERRLKDFMRRIMSELNFEQGRAKEIEERKKLTQ